VTTFTVSDPTVVSVSSTGLLHAERAGAGITVVARLTIGALTLSDTTIVNVNTVAPPPMLTTLSIQPAEGDSAKVAAGYGAFISPTILDEHDNPLFNLAVHFRSSDTTIVTVDQFGSVQGMQPGHATLYVEAMAYGVEKIDSLPYVVGAPIFATDIVSARTPRNSPTPESYFSPQVLTIGVGGYVLWINQSGQPVDIVFDDPSAAQAVEEPYLSLFAFLYGLTGPYNPNESGNIPAFVAADSTAGADGQGTRIRWFTQEGTYPYHSTLYNTSGTIVVTRE
jgi:hypothetical protein